MKLVSKWNWKNFYGFEWDQILEIVKLRDYYYRTVYIIGEWLRAVGNPLKKNEYVLE